MDILKLEGKLRLLANPHSEKRMELILKQLEVSDSQASKPECEDAENGEDEVSFMYYGENCSCSKNSMCKSSKCLCFLRGELCSTKCHVDLKNKCTNK